MNDDSYLPGTSLLVDPNFKLSCSSLYLMNDDRNVKLHQITQKKNLTEHPGLVPNVV
jgi:hypothetical protein